MVGSEFSDDAAVVRLPGDDSRALVLTTDVIAPLVDEPEAFGAIAACNALSDVYAMGGTPLYALNLVFFPDDKLPLEILSAIMRGAAETCREAGVPVVGGHTVRDQEVKFGLAVTGEVPPDRVLSNRGARAGQHLVLTKALGTGVLGSAIKKGVASAAEHDAAVRSMRRLNAEALAIGLRHGASSCTDVTGFGLLGHLRNILLGSDLCAFIDVDRVPLLPGALAHAEAGQIPGGSRANKRFLDPSLRVPDHVSETLALLLADAQTSGGLLLCLDAEHSEAAVEALRATDHEAATVGVLARADPAAGMPIGTTQVR